MSRSQVEEIAVVVGRVRRSRNRPQVILDFIGAYHKERGIAPSYREIGSACGMAISLVKYWLDKLEAAGLIRRYEGLARGIVLVK